MGMRKPVAGSITLEGKSIVGLRPFEIARLGVGFAPEESEVFGDLTVAENILLPTWTRQTARPAEEREALAYRVFPKLERYRSRGGQQLSGGERKMVSIARLWRSTPNCCCWTSRPRGCRPRWCRRSSRVSPRFASWGTPS
jgi:branched-chain amino acid transport system ATP-binding protein